MLQNEWQPIILDNYSKSQKHIFEILLLSPPWRATCSGCSLNFPKKYAYFLLYFFGTYICVRPEPYSSSKSPICVSKNIFFWFLSFENLTAERFLNYLLDNYAFLKFSQNFSAILCRTVYVPSYLPYQFIFSTRFCN